MPHGPITNPAPSTNVFFLFVDLSFTRYQHLPQKEMPCLHRRGEQMFKNILCMCVERENGGREAGGEKANVQIIGEKRV